MELLFRLKIEKLPEGVHLATSEEIPGLVAQGRTISETLEIARYVANRIIEARQERNDPLPLPETEGFSEYRIVVGA